MNELQTLLSCHLFQDLAPAAVEPLLAQSDIREYARGGTLWLRGDVATHIYVVLDGHVQDRFISEDGREIVFGTWSPGGVLGQPGIFSANRIRMVDCVAFTAARVIRIPRAALIDFLHKHPPAMLRMLELLADDLRAFTFQGLGHAFDEIDGRVAKRLLDLAAAQGAGGPDGVRINLTLTQADLARMVGASREQVNRALRRLARGGLVVPEGGTYRLPDPDALARTLGDVEDRVRRPGLSSSRVV